MYLDCNATLPVKSAHLEKLAELLKSSDANPSSPHQSGRKTKIAMEEARDSLSQWLGCNSEEIIFCSGATEANNLVIQGLINLKYFSKMSGGVKNGISHVIRSSLEHPSVAEVMQTLSDRQMIQEHIVRSTQDGFVDSDDLDLKIHAMESLDLFCCIWAHNEIGTIQNLSALIAKVRKKFPQAHIHIDGVQALGKITELSLGAMDIDSASFSGHKLGALKGCGLLYLRRGKKLGRFLLGGGQERGRRAGTESIPSILSFGMMARENLSSSLWKHHKDRAILKYLREKLKSFKDVVIHGSEDLTKQLPNTLHFHVESIPGDDWIINLDLEGIQLSSGSACSSGSGRPSPSLLAMGYDEWVSLNSIRLSFGENFSLEQAEIFLKKFEAIYSRLHG